jgi:CMP-N-acetylneuraminic acid synthetase
LNYQVVIPARGGSKRFPKKNVIDFCGKPLIAHTIEYALESFSSNKIWVNTDDEEIKKIALGFGINITIRPEFLGSDTASTAEVLSFQCQQFEKDLILCDAIILLQATNPIRPEKLIVDCIDVFEINNRGSLASFSKLNKKYGQIQDDDFKPKNYQPGQRMQDINPDYFENGLIYITKTENLLKGEVITKDVFPFIYNGIESSVDIDEVDDLTFAEYVYKKLKNKI